ncbi:LysR family transcriptional regulator [Tsukamurella sp. M9C]|uniref:LysR family transcriptional regulator n=1 Tax=unclassified Tsukamurella TaxID=2633480 RepID=UPI001CC8F9DE|nr:LysR family transcriptional regulator [Tsukamurella sp. M9C]MCA0157018.1 LysR family transcriptional regulator [Tsukamurella sp. M9C]
MSDIERLRLVAAVAGTHSMHEAARAHGVAQSTVTRAVAATEQMVGMQLFRRGTSGAQLAAGARTAITLIERIVAAYDELAALGGGAAAAGLRFVHRQGVPIPDRLDGAIVRWNRAESVRAELVLDDDPLGAVRAGRAEFAVERFDRQEKHDLEGEVIRLTRLDRVELLNRPAPSDTVRAFLTFLG